MLKGKQKPKTLELHCVAEIGHFQFVILSLLPCCSFSRTSQRPEISPGRRKKAFIASCDQIDDQSLSWGHFAWFFAQKLGIRKSRTTRLTGNRWVASGNGNVTHLSIPVDWWRVLMQIQNIFWKSLKFDSDYFPFGNFSRFFIIFPFVPIFFGHFLN